MGLLLSRIARHSRVILDAFFPISKFSNNYINLKSPIQMKNVFKMATLTFMLFLVAACSKDDSKETVQPAPKIEGKWVYYKVGAFPDGIEKEEGYEAYHNNCTTSQEYKEILDNGIYKEVQFDYECVSTTHNASWTKTDNFITFDAPVGDSYNKYEILFLDETTLKLKIVESCCRENRASTTHIVFKRINW